MSAEVIVAIISGVFTFAGVVITVVVSYKSTEKKIKQQSDLTIYRIEQLENKQDEHNKLIERMYKAEDKINVLNERQNNVIHRLDDVEAKQAGMLKLV